MVIFNPTPVQLVDGTGNIYTAGGGGAGASDVNIAKVNGTAVGQANPLYVSNLAPNTDPDYFKGAYATTTDDIASSVNAVSTTLAALDLRDLQAISIQVNILTTYTGTYQFQVSNDGVLWIAKNFVNVTGGLVNTDTMTAVAPGIRNVYVGDTGARYFRVVQTAWTAGQIRVISSLSALSMNTMPQQSTTLNSGNIANNLGRVNIYDGTNAAAIKGSGVSAAITDAALVATLSPNTYAGVAAHYLTSAATTNATAVKGSAGTLFEFDVSNTSAATIYFKLFNLAAAPTVGTSTPVMVIPIAAGATTVTELGQMGKRFTTGISYSITGAVATSDTTAVAAGILVGATYI